MTDRAENDYESWQVPIYEHEELAEFERLSVLACGIHRIRFNDGPSLDVLIEGLEKLDGWKRVPVFFNGAVGNRSDKQGPFFSGRGLASSAGYGFVAISDPSTTLSKNLGLAWYAGNQFSTLEEPVLRVLKTVQRLLGLQLLLIGGSGGGFAALKFASLVGETATALAWNPQSDILKYNEDAVKKYLVAAFPAESVSFVDEENWSDGASDFLKRNNIRHELLTLPARPGNTVLLQNASDWHVSAHLSPLARAWEIREVLHGIHTDGKGTFVLISDFGDGHASPPAGSLQAAIVSLAKLGSSANETVLELKIRPELSKGEPRLLPTDLSARRKEILDATRLSVARDTSHEAIVAVEHDGFIHNYGGIRYSFFVTTADGSERTVAFMPASNRRLEINEGDVSVGVRLRDGFGTEICEIVHSLDPEQQ
ncbi:hypothetical protein HD598_000874 [Neomicrococcus aestuarii]|uniref:Uncharacterized protein n=1 Tax=Neomicrococcus aestuarii TaxID=556325 RepID=A0A7W8TSL9_9MICC|nr:hypothetical protein [Neomicrococcus aestuarii]MBB5512187.1 hypothetical protein [Neomicrococcus aestuarii]